LQYLQQLGSSTINSYLQQIGYGNKNISGDFSSYWMQSSLKISPVEQVELLKNYIETTSTLLLLIFMPSKIPSILPPLKMENLWKNRNRTSERAGYKWLVYRFYRKPK
jgi:beta-lactamase class D